MWHFLFIDFKASIYTGPLKPVKKRIPINVQNVESFKIGVEEVIKPRIRVKEVIKPNIRVEL